MKKTFNLLTLAVLSLVVFFLLPMNAHAESQASFSMEAILPENQRESSQVTYFDLLVEPAQQQTITVRFTNLSDKPLSLDLKGNTATTNNAGNIDYGDAKKEKDSSAKFVFSELAQVPDKVNLEAKEVKDVAVKLNIPKDPFTGIILGGIRAIETPKTNESSNKNSIQLNNQYALTLGVVLSESEKAIEPDLKLNDVRPGLDNGFTAVLANLQNVMPQLTGSMKITGTVFKAGEKTPLRETVRENQSMAPNSNFDFPISWDNQEIKAGKYTLELVAKSATKEWRFSRDFEITGEQEKQINKEAVGIKKSYLWVYILVGILLMMLLLFLAFLIGRRSKKEE